MEVYVYRPDRFGLDWRRKGSFESVVRVEVYLPDGSRAITEFRPDQVPQLDIGPGSLWSKLKYQLGKNQLKQAIIVVYGDDGQPVLRLQEIGQRETVEIIVYLPDQEDGFVVGYRGKFRDLYGQLGLDRQIGPPPEDSLALNPRAV